MEYFEKHLKFVKPIYIYINITKTPANYNKSVKILNYIIHYLRFYQNCREAI